MSFKLDDFWKNVAKLSGGTVLAQVVAFVCGPVITRIYNAETYGTLGIYSSIAGPLIIIGALRYERAILLSKKEDSRQLLSLCLFLITTFSIVLLLSLSFFYPFLNCVFRLQDVPFILFLLPVSVFLNSSMNTFYAFGNSYKAYGILSVSVAIHSFTANILKILLGLYWEPSPQALVLSEIIGIFSATVFLMAFIRRKAGALFERPVLARMKHIARLFQKFPKYDTLTALVNTLSWLLPAFLLDYFFSKEHVGYYTLGFTMLRMPMNLIGKAVGDVFYRTAIDESVSTDKLAATSTKTVLQLFSFGLIPTVIVLFFGEELFSFFFGAKWVTAGTYSQILAFWSLVWFISSPISNLFYILDLQNKFLVFMTVSFILRLAALIVGGFVRDPSLALVLYSLVSSCVYGGQIFYLLKKLNVKFPALLKRVIDDNLYFVWPLVALILIKYLVPGVIFQLLLVILTGASAFWFLFKRKKARSI